MSRFAPRDENLSAGIADDHQSPAASRAAEEVRDDRGELGGEEHVTAEDDAAALIARAHARAVRRRGAAALRRPRATIGREARPFRSRLAESVRRTPPPRTRGFKRVRRDRREREPINVVRDDRRCARARGRERADAAARAEVEHGAPRDGAAAGRASW